MCSGPATVLHRRPLRRLIRRFLHRLRLRQIRVWDLSTLECVRSWKGHWRSAMAYCDNHEATHSSFNLNNNKSSDPRATHARLLKSTATDISLFNNLITHYFKSNLSSYALSLFTRIPSPNVVTWTALITAHSNSLHSLRHFLSMLRHSILPNHRTVASLFVTCASLSSISFALSLHSLCLKLALSHHPFPASSLLTFYSKCRLPNHALRVFDETPHRDNVSYSAIIVALAQNFRFSDALFLFADMRCQGFYSTVHSVSGALRAAAQLAALEQCRIIHAHAVVAGLDSNVVVGTSLVDGYGKTGFVKDARRVFEDNIYCMNVVGWNAMLAGYALQGDCQLTLELFDSMKGYGFVPDEYSFLAILTSLYNAGMFMLIDVWLNRMKVDYGLEPTLEHYTCLVGGVARVGQLERAERIVSTMPFEPDAAVWRALLSACAYHGAVDKARVMARRVLELEPHDDSAFVIVANVLSAAGRWDDVAELRKTMKDRRVKKKGGRSWIEVQGKVHVFVAGDWKHERSVEIYQKLEELMGDIEKLGYVPVWDELLHNVGEEKSKDALWYHSEKLAVAFGVLCGSIPPGKALRIVKNLRICKDCHEAFKYMTRVLEREIIVRDVNRYHRFVNGDCTCRDICDHTLKVWSLDGVLDNLTAPINLKAKAVVAAHFKDINSVAVAPNDSLVCSGSQDRTACVWRLPDLVSVVVFKGHKRGIWSVEFSPVDQCVVTASGDKTIRIWAISDGSCLKTFEGHTSSVLRALLVTRGTQIVSCGADGLVKLWTVKSNECVATYDHHVDKVWALAVGSKTELLATGGSDAVVNLWLDSTAADKEEAFRKEEEGVLKGQELENALSDADYTKAVQIAFELRRPHKLLELFAELCRKKGAEDHIDRALKSFGNEELRLLFNYIREWNTKPKLCYVSQFVLFRVFNIFPPTDIVQIKGVGELLEGLIPYSQRHFGRIDRLVRSTFLLDFILSGMSVIEPETHQAELKDGFPLQSEIDASGQENENEEKDNTIENNTASKKRKSHKSKHENGIEDQTLENDTASKKRKSSKSKHGSHKKVKDVAYNKIESIPLQA